MYIHPHVFETISRDAHEERIAHAERRGFAFTTVDAYSIGRGWSCDAGHRRLVRAVQTLALRQATALRSWPTAGPQ